MLARTAVLLAAAVLVMGCGAEDDTGSGSGDGAAAAKLTGPVHYVRSGGIAGMTEDLTLRPDGTATLQRRRGTQSKDARLAPSDAVVGDVAAALDGFAGLPADSASPQPVPDAFVYTVTYAGHTVKTDDAAKPAALVDLLNALNRVVASSGKRP